VVSLQAVAAVLPMLLRLVQVEAVAEVLVARIQVHLLLLAELQTQVLAEAVAQMLLT
jgi:hypothetical protein